MLAMGEENGHETPPGMIIVAYDLPGVHLQINSLVRPVTSRERSICITPYGRRPTFCSKLV